MEIGDGDGDLGDQMYPFTDERYGIWWDYGDITLFMMLLLHRKLSCYLDMFFPLRSRPLKAAYRW